MVVDLLSVSMMAKVLNNHVQKVLSTVHLHADVNAVCFPSRSKLLLGNKKNSISIQIQNMVHKTTVFPNHASTVVNAFQLTQATNANVPLVSKVKTVN